MIIGLLAQISCYGRVITVAQLALAISGQIGKPVHVQQRLESSLVYVGGAETSPRDLLADAAVALHATMRETSSSISIERDAKAVSETQKQKLSLRVKWIRDRLNAVKRFRDIASMGVPAQQAFASQVARQRAQVEEVSKGKRNSIDPFYPEQLLPAEVLLEALIQRIGVEQIAAVPSLSVKIFQDEPVGAEAKLPECSDLLAQYQTSMASRAGAGLTQQGQKLSPASRSGDASSSFGNPADVSKLRLRVLDYVGFVIVLLEGYSPSGGRILTANFGAGPLYGFKDSTLGWEQFDPKSVDRVVGLREESRAAIEFLSNPPQNFPSWFLHADSEEPLDLFVRDVLSEIAKVHPEKTLVVSVGESLWTAATRTFLNKQIRLDSFLAYIRTWMPYECGNSGASIILRPIDNSAEELSASKRTALAKFGSSLDKRTTIGISQAAHFLLSAGKSVTPLARSWLGSGYRYVGTDPGIYVVDFGDDMLRALGSITDEQWEILRAGHPFHVGELGVADALTVVLDRAMSPRIHSGAAGSDWDLFPRQLMPDGLPDNATITFSDQSLTFVKSWSSGSEPKDVFEPEEVFLKEFRLVSPRIEGDGAARHVVADRDLFERKYASTHIRLVRQPTFVLVLGLPTGASLPVTIRGSTSNDPDSIQFSELSQEVRDLIFQNSCDQALGLSPKTGSILGKIQASQGSGHPQSPNATMSCWLP